MPTISAFYGIVIRMYWDDHGPPHFHAYHGRHAAVIEIRSLTVVRGSLPRLAATLTLEWAALHRDELMENWYLCATRHPPRMIAPLE